VGCQPARKRHQRRRRAQHSTAANLVLWPWGWHYRRRDGVSVPWEHPQEEGVASEEREFEAERQPQEHERGERQESRPPILVRPRRDAQRFLLPGAHRDEPNRGSRQPLPRSVIARRISCLDVGSSELTCARRAAWRKILKDLIAYFREIQTHYEHRAKSLLKVANVLNNIATPPGFLASGGLDDALHMLRGHNKQAIVDANKAREIEEDVILALTGLRSDLHQKIKEIKNLSGDFKNSVEKEMDGTRRAVNQLQEALGQTELDTSLTIGKQDPYLLRLAVDRQLERQIDEENYLHQVRRHRSSSDTIPRSPN